MRGAEDAGGGEAKKNATVAPHMCVRAAAMRSAATGDTEPLQRLPTEAFLDPDDHGMTAAVLATKRGQADWLRALALVPSLPPSGRYGRQGLSIRNKRGWYVQIC